MKSLRTLLILLLLAWGIAARATDHPVALENNDPAQCASCHEDKTKGKAVHSAIAMGCNSCHDVKVVNKDQTTVELVAKKEELCFTCHANESKPEDSKHGPWEKGQCVLCHDPHTSDNAKQLRAAGNALCLECHDASKGPLPETVKVFNHEVKREDLAGLRRLKLNSDLQRGHPLGNHWVSTIPDPTRPGEKMACLTCHVPHSSSEDKLARVLSLKDTAGKEVKMDACNACHDAYDRVAAERRIQNVPEVEKQIQQTNAEAAKKREEYLKRLPKVAGDERDYPQPAPQQNPQQGSKP